MDLRVRQRHLCRTDRDVAAGVRGHPPRRRALLRRPERRAHLSDSQRITERYSRYWVVEKTGEPRAVAKRTDPRSHDDGPLPCTRSGRSSRQLRRRNHDRKHPCKSWREVVWVHTSYAHRVRRGRRRRRVRGLGRVCRRESAGQRRPAGDQRDGAAGSVAEHDDRIVGWKRRSASPTAGSAAARAGRAARRSRTRPPPPTS